MAYFLWKAVTLHYNIIVHEKSYLSLISIYRSIDFQTTYEH